MTKILLVEDDKNLREIYGTRLYAEGYDIVSAGDGEEALAMAIRELPDLIISDVMMPKISGFDMLDILRTSEDTKDIPVIMMTALSSEDQRARGESLGATRYLVKSQVGIEDVVRTVHEVLGDVPGMTPAAAAPTPPADLPAPQPVAPQPPTPPQPIAQSTPQPQAATPQPQIQQPPQPTAPVAPQPVAPAPQPAASPQPQDTGALPQPIAPFSTKRPAGLGDRVIHPLEQKKPQGQSEDMATMMAAALSGDTASAPVEVDPSDAPTPTAARQDSEPIELPPLPSVPPTEPVIDQSLPPTQQPTDEVQSEQSPPPPADNPTEQAPTQPSQQQQQPPQPPTPN